jgi:filamentous hemagglutinin family protein
MEGTFIHCWKFYLASCSLVVTVTCTAVNAQVVPDNKLPNRSTVTKNGNVSEITDGTTRGNNLFHSFEQFSLPTGTEAHFKNDANIENIFSRVTGNSISDIDGLIRANGNANLFLLNPNGVLFGPNAALDIGGSLIVGTADSVKFADGSEFSATNPQAPPILTINTPVGLQYGANAGDIVVQGEGNNLSVDFSTFVIDRSARPEGLQVAPGQTLAIVGGNVALEGGNLTAQEGRIELGGVGAGTVKLIPASTGWRLSYEDINTFKNINLTQAASIDTSSNSGGEINLQGRRITIFDGSALIADTLGDGRGGALTVKSTESIEIVGNAIANPFYGGIFADVYLDAPGNGGNVNIETGRLLVAEGTQISAGTFGSGNAGTINVKAQNLEVLGSSNLSASGLYTPVGFGKSGNGGDIRIETGRLLVSDGAQIQTSSFGGGASGNAGNLTVEATNIEVIGADFFGSSGLFTNVQIGGKGDSGRLTISTERLRLADGGQVDTTNAGFGEAGALTIQANDIELTGFNNVSFFKIPTALSSNVGEENPKNGVDLNINANRLLVSNGAQISSSTNGSGNGGELNIRANEVRLIGRTDRGRSGLFSNALVGTGNGGNLNLTTGSLIIEDGATINVGNIPSGKNFQIFPGRGSPGNLNIQTQSLTLDNESVITAETLAGNRGNINIQAQDIQLFRGSGITTNAREEASGGNIFINTNNLIARGNSEITANARGSGSAGNLKIEADLLELQQSRINATGNQGNLSLVSQNTLLTQESEISTNASGNNSGGNITLATGNLSLLSESNISSNASGFGSGGDINIKASSPNTIWLDRSEISARGGQGNITLNSPTIVLRRGSQINTDGIGTLPGGNIIINSDFLLAVLAENSDITANAQQSRGGSVIVTIQGIFGIEPQNNQTRFSDITASSELGSLFSGNIEIIDPNADTTSGTTRLPSEVVDASDRIAPGCSANLGNTFVVTGRGGLPDNPSQTLRGNTVWQDFRDLSVSTSQTTQRKTQPHSLEPAQIENASAPIIEAQGWIEKGDGRIELVANARDITPQGVGSQIGTCGDF